MSSAEPNVEVDDSCNSSSETDREEHDVVTDSESEIQSESESESDGYQNDRCIDSVQGETDRIQNVSESVPNKVVVRGMGGTGKSTLAALVASRRDIRQKFDNIFWIDVGKFLSSTKDNEVEKTIPVRNNLTYDRYRECLRVMCRQLDVTIDSEGIHRKFNEEVVRSPGDRSMQVATKHLRAILAARSEMSRVLYGRGNTLVILDDLWSGEDIDLFNFNSDASSLLGGLSILITTRTIDMAPLQQTFTLSLGVLNERDVIHLIGL